MFKKSLLLVLFSVSAVSAQAEVIVYDYANANSSSNTALSASTVAPNFTASDLELNNASNTASVFTNHFYHTGWDSGINTNKYYEATIGANTGDFSLDSVIFSMENTGGSSNYWLRSSLDGFIGDISTGSFINGVVTDFDVSLSSLGLLNSPISFRWYIGSTSRAGFSNHNSPGAGFGLPDVGVDLVFSVPEPATLTIFSLGLLGLASRRRKVALKA